MDRRVVLIQPEIGEWDWVRTRPHFPLGILQAASRVAVCEPVVLLDQRIQKNWRGRLEELIGDDPLCVAVTSMSGSQIRYALAASRLVKKIDPRVPVIWGGLHASMLAGQTLQEASIDIVVRGEGEETFGEVVEALKDGRTMRGIQGVSWKENGNVSHNPDRSFLDLERMPEVPYHLVNVEDYLPRFRDVPSLNLETSRGCPNRCTYCYNYRYNRCTWRCQSPSRVLERLRYAVRELGVKGVYLTDDNFFARVDRGLEIARRIREERLGLQWQLQGVEISTLRDLSSRDLDLLAASGCVRLSFGADSGSDRILKRLRKKHRARDIAEVNRRLAGYDITLYYSFLSGIPTETPEDLDETLDLILTLVDENPHARVSPLYNYFPFPGALLYEEIVEAYGYRAPETLEDWGKIDYGAVNIGYVAPAMRKRVQRIYLPSLFLDRKFHEYNTRPWLRVLSDLYRPLARYRVRNRFFGFPLEAGAARLYTKLRKPGSH
jgi:anaerobic magnesium-protoporphyrin IX monomethyl ester cyclase